MTIIQWNYCGCGSLLLVFMTTCYKWVCLVTISFYRLNAFKLINFALLIRAGNSSITIILEQARLTWSQFRFSTEHKVWRKCLLHECKISRGIETSILCLVCCLLWALRLVLLSFDDLIVFNLILTVYRIQGDIAPVTSLTCLNFQWKH